MMRFILPLVVFLVLAAFLYAGLSLDPHEVPSPLIDKPAPAFTLPQLHDPKKQFSSEEMKGKVWLLNVWASWCVSCREEHPLLMELRENRLVPIHGLNYKDKPADAEKWLNELGDPYTRTGADINGHAGNCVDACQRISPGRLGRFG